MGIYNQLFSYENFQVTDKGFSCGVSIEYLNHKNSLNFAFKFGTRKSDFSDFQDEKYFNFYFTMLNGEDWFNNKRNK